MKRFSDGETSVCAGADGKGLLRGGVDFLGDACLHAGCLVFVDHLFLRGDIEGLLCFSGEFRKVFHVFFCDGSVDFFELCMQVGANRFVA